MYERGGRKMKTYNVILKTDISFERFQEIENEREQTMSDPNYQKWFKELNISRAYIDNVGILRARDLMEQYDYSKYEFHIK